MAIERGANVNARDEVQATPLHYAAEHANVSIARMLIESGADMDARNRWGSTPLHSVAPVQSRSVVPGASFAAHDHRYPEEDYIQVARMLVERGADVNARNDDGETPLQRAANTDWPDIVGLMVEYGADVNQRIEGMPALAYAAYGGWLGVARLLVERGADVNVRTKHGNTVLYEAVDGHFHLSGTGLEFIRTLIERGAEVNAKNWHGRTALHHAVTMALSESVTTQNSTQLVRLLLDGGADVNARNDKGLTALHFIAQFEFFARRIIVQGRRNRSRHSSITVPTRRGSEHRRRGRQASAILRGDGSRGTWKLRDFEHNIRAA